jgi:opacity protein-like surface antigen
MKNYIRLAILALMLGLTLGPARAQVPAVEGTVDYSFLNTWPGHGLGSYHTNGGGGQFTVSLPFAPVVGLTADLQGSSGSKYTNSLFTYTFGPRVKFAIPETIFEPFVEALFGGATINANSGNYGVSRNAFAMLYGGGLDLRLSSHFAVRPFQLDYEYTNFTSQHQNGFRYQAGVQIRF